MIPFPVRKELLDQQWFICMVWRHVKMITKCFWLHGFRDHKGVWHRSRLLIISYKSGIWNETPKKKTRFRYSKIPLGTLRSSVSGTRGLLNFPEHNLKNCSWREIMYAKKSSHLANKLNCRLVYKPHSSIIVLTTELLQSAAGRGLNAPQPAWLNLWWDSNRVWHTAASLILFLSLQNRASISNTSLQLARLTGNKNLLHLSNWCHDICLICKTRTNSSVPFISMGTNSDAQQEQCWHLKY